MADYEYGEVTGTKLEVDTKPGGVSILLNATPLELLQVAYAIVSRYHIDQTPPSVTKSDHILNFANSLINVLSAENLVIPTGD